MENFKNKYDKSTLDFFNQIAKYEILTQDECLKLIEKAQNGDIDSRNKLIESNLKLVKIVAKNYLNYNVPILDLIESGILGLINAISDYDKTKDTKFSTYATWWIRQAIRRYIENNLRMVRIPVHLQKAMDILKKIEIDYYIKNDYYPSDHELLNEYKKFGKINLDLERLKALKYFYQDTISLNEFMKSDDGESDIELIELIKTKDDETDKIVEKESEIEYFRNILNGSIKSNLSKNERIVLWYRFGFSKNQEIKTLSEIGQSLNLTKERVRQIESKALYKMKQIITISENKELEKTI